jgi:hypothetical protein
VVQEAAPASGFGKKAAAKPVAVKAAPQEEAAPASGFGKKVAAKAAPKPVAVAPEPAEAPVAAASSLSDEIAALIGNLDDDD